MTARRGSFGGGAAWRMRKRKTAEPLDRSLTESSSAHANTATALQVPASKTTKPSIVWDEERCRIVYESSSVPVSNNNKSNNASATEEEEDDDDVSADDATSCCWEQTSYDMDENEPVAVPRVSMEKPNDIDISFPMQVELNVVATSSTTTGKGRRGGKRSYASRKRVLLQSPTLSDAVLDVQDHHNRRTSKRTKKRESDDNESKLADTETGTSLHNILTQESVSHEEEEDSLEGALVAGETASSQEEAKAPTSSPVQPEPSSMFDFDDTEEEKAEKHKATSRRPKRASTTTAVQPSSKTSLDKARCFFEQLDAKEQLTLDNSKTPPRVAAGKSNACIRTRRRQTATAPADPAVLNEYKEYVTACQESGVTPRPVQSSFFRSTAIYDGFLDE